MHRLIVLFLIGSLAGAGCGRFSTGEVTPDEPVSVGDGVGLGDATGDQAATATSAPTAHEQAGGGEPAPAATGELVAESYHPRAPSGELMRNVTVREVDGLTLQLMVQEIESQPGDLLFDLLITNERETALFFDPTYDDAIVISDDRGNRVWSTAECELQADSDYGHPTLKAGDDTVLTFRYAGDGNGDGTCVLPPGDYQVVAHFAWCHPDRHDGKECRELTTSQSHPLAVRFAEG